MSESSSLASGGIGFRGLLQIAFIVLKLTGYIGWSWWWVLSPTWISASLAVVAIVAVVLIEVGEQRARRKKFENRREEVARRFQSAANDQ